MPTRSYGQFKRGILDPLEIEFTLSYRSRFKRETRLQRLQVVIKQNRCLYQNARRK